MHLDMIFWSVTENDKNVAHVDSVHAEGIAHVEGGSGPPRLDAR